MTLATLTTDLIAPFTTDTPVETDPTADQIGEMVMVYVTSTYRSAGSQEDVGTFQLLRGSRSQEGWIKIDESGNAGARLFGAVVDPAPVNGRTYRMLGGSTRFLVRYNDEDHTGDRHRSAHAWSVIGADGTLPHYVNDDSIHEDNVRRMHYIEVAGPAAAPETDDRSSLPATIGNEETGATRGLAVTDAEGMVALNPARVDGKMYLVWNAVGRMERETQVAVFHGPADPADSRAGFISMGAYYGAGAEARVSATERTIPDHGQIAWAELALVRPEVTEDHRVAGQAKESAFYAEVAALETKYEDFNEALNELAKEKGWCSEYEDIITPLGMTGRTNKKYDVEVTVEFSADIDSPSSALDSRVESEVGGSGISLSSVSISGSATVTIYGVETEDTDSFSDYISTSDVEDALDNQLSSVSNLSVSDWSVEDWNEADD
jgi:hypothetical protein